MTSQQLDKKASRIIRAAAVAFASASMAFAGAASADTLVYNGPWFGSYFGTYNIRDANPTNVNINVYSGAFRMTDTSGATFPVGTSFMAWCVDIHHWLNTSSSGASYSYVTGPSYFGISPDRTGRLESLASYVVANDGNPATNTLQTALTGSMQSAAFQLAVWEIVNEAGSSPTYNVNSGDFYVASGDTSVRNLANAWLAGSTGFARTQALRVWSGPDSTQDLAVFAPIPEPETYAMLLAGLGLMGFVARRRRMAAAV